MNTRRIAALATLFLLGLALPLAAQRGSSSRPSTRPSPSPRVQAPRVQAPRPSTPRVQAPRPSTPRVQAPRPSAPRVQAPSAPRVQAPRPSSRPSVQTPSTPRFETPRAASPRPSIPSPRATDSRSTRGSLSRPTTPSYRDATPSTPRTAPTRSYTPRTTSQSQTRRPVGGTITRPTTTLRTPDRGTRDGGTSRSSARIRDTSPVPRSRTGRDDRYAPTRPVRSPTQVDRGGRPTGDSISRDRTSTVTGTRTPRTTTPRATTPVARDRGAGRTPTTAGATAPRLVPRAEAPRLTAPRRGSVVAGATARLSPRSSWSHHRSYANCDPWLWNSWWRPWQPATAWWSWGWGCAPRWNWFASPWNWCNNIWWNDCYSWSWFHRWNAPFHSAANFWWYPSTTYCPVYLQVPSSVVVVDGAALADGTGGGAVVAGAPALPPDPGARGLPADDLAAKYVDLARYYFEAGRFADAMDAYTRARGYAPNDGPLHFEFADAAFANGDHHYAAFLIAEAVRLEPALATADVDKRAFYGDPKLFDEQMAALERYLAEKPYDAACHFVRGYNLRFSGDPDGAEAAFRRVLEIAPEHRGAAAFLAAMADAPDAR